MKKKSWFRMQVNEDDPTLADVFIFGFIGDWIDDLFSDIGWGFDSVTTAKSFQEELDALPDDIKTIRLHVNSPGGDVFGAATIANMLRDQRVSKGRAVEANVQGLAASAASIVIQAGDPVRISDNGLIMIHDPWTRAAGNARELRAAADELDKITESSIIGTYRWHSDLEPAEIADLMAKTTWMDAEEAVANGFATEIVEGLQAAASIDARALKKLNVPDKYRERIKAFFDIEKSSDSAGMEPGEIVYEEPAKATEVLRLCREADCLDIAESLVEDGLSIERVQQRVKAETEIRNNAKARAAEIRALCEKANLSDLADGYIKGQMDIEEIKGHLTTLTAKFDQLEIDGSLDPDQGARPKAKINVSEIYAARNRLQLVAGKKE